MDKILIIDDDIDTCTLLKHFLTKNGYEVQTSVSGAAGIKKLHAEEYALILCDFRLGDMDAREVLQAAKLINSKTQIIVITGYSDVKIAVEVIKAGAFNYVTKPLLPDEILMNVKNAINKFHNVSSGIGVTSISGAEIPAEKTILNNESGVAETKYIEGKSKESITVYKQLDIVGPTNYCVIIYGESGTGKEIAARRIHEKSKRANAPFIAVDCGALSKELAGSELFGHEKGAFTGALNSKMGSFELANGGTLLLDEVANLSYDVQIMLLRVVQERKMKRIGGIKDIDLDVRLIVASNENLMDAVNKGKFREDLYHRFNEFTIVMPSLRDRNVDIMEFANFFLKNACVELNKRIHAFSEEVEIVFLKYTWPGNLRELNNVVRRGALLTDGKIIELESLPQELIHSEKYNFTDKDTYNTTIEPNNLKAAAFDAEHKVISETLKKVKYNKSKAARMLNVDRKTLYNKMKQYNIRIEQEEKD